MNTLILAVGISTMAAVVSIIGIRLVRWRVSKDTLSSHQAIADPMLNVVATLYAVLLGFVVAAAMDRYEKARDNADTEATSVHTIYHLARGLSDPNRKLIRNSCREYCVTVIHDEWPEMEHGNTSPKAWEAYSKLWDQIMSFSPSNDREVCADEGLVAEMQQLAENRSSRVVALKRTVGPATWLFVWGGAAITMVFTYLLASRGTVMQSVMTALVAVSIGLNMVLLFVIATPFAGDFKVHSTAFELNLQMMAHDPGKPLSIQDDDDEDSSGADAKKKSSADSAKKSADSAKKSEDAAKKSEDTAKKSEDTAKKSEDAAKKSAASAKKSHSGAK